MQGITRRQVVSAVRYQEALAAIEADRLYVVVNEAGHRITRPVPHITAEHFVAELSHRGGIGRGGVKGLQIVPA